MAPDHPPAGISSTTASRTGTPFSSVTWMRILAGEAAFTAKPASPSASAARNIQWSLMPRH